MKDKVKQLAEQAGFVLWSDEDWKPEGQVIDWSSVYDKELEKFAKLLIKECAQICQTVSAEQVDNASKDYQEGREMGATVCRNQIKKHFGVE